MALEFTPEHLNRFTLASHFLTKSARPAEFMKVVGRICGLNAQTARGPYISLWSRIKGFKREHLARAFSEKRALVKAWLMRGTVHMIPAEDFSIYQCALRTALVTEWDRVLSKQTRVSLPKRRAKLYDSMVDMLSGEALTKREILPRVRHLLKGYEESEQRILIGWALRTLTYQGLVCHAESTGPWYHFKDNRFTTVINWIRGGRVEEHDQAEARTELLLRYLRGYGPASIQDFAYWTSLKMREANQALDGARPRLEEIKIKGSKNCYWLLKEDMARLERIRGRSKIPVRFLPEFDPLIMGHKDKSRIIDDEHRKHVFLRLADVAPVILIDGRVGGTWNYRMTQAAFEMSPFGRRQAEGQARINREAQSLIRFLH